MPYHYDLFAQHSDDPLYQHGDAVQVLDAKGQPIPDVIAYDQRSGRLDFFAQVDGKREAVVKIWPGLTVALPNRKQAPMEPASPASASEAVAAPAAEPAANEHPASLDHEAA